MVKYVKRISPKHTVMKKEDNEILRTIARRDGIRVPEGYFADFARHMADSLPERPELSQMSASTPPSGIWGRIRPYVYMAAMFAGVWCMLKMFTTVTAPGELTPMDKNPVMAEAFGNDDFIDNYVLDDVNQWDVIDQMMEDGFDPGTLDEPDSTDFEAAL